jgi:hypothetical protein
LEEKITALLGDWSLKVVFLLHVKGSAMAQAGSFRPVTVEVSVLSQTTPHGICGGQSGIGTDFSQSITVFFFVSITP